MSIMHVPYFWFVLAAFALVIEMIFGTFYLLVAGVAAMLAGLLWLASCSSSPKSRDYTGYMTRPYTIRGHRYHPMSVEQALGFEQTGIASHYNECALWGLVSGSTAI